MARVVAESQNVAVTWRSRGGIIGAAALAGIFWWALTSLLGRHVVEQLTCGSSQMLTACGDAFGIAGSLSLVIISAAMLFIFVVLRQPRPLLVVLGALLVLWPLGQYSTGLPWYEALLWSVVLYTAVYALFILIARITRVWVALAVTLLVALLVRTFTFF